MISRPAARNLGVLALIFLFAAAEADAQIPGALRRAAGRVVGRAAAGLTPDELLNRAPITTSLEDARFAANDRDGFTPREPLRQLTSLRRTDNGGFILEPGYFEMHAQSYCLKAGTHGPGGGDGYLYAPPLGPAELAVMSIVRNSVSRPEIPQRDIQLLLWAIIARSQFEDLEHGLQATAARLLTPRQLATLNRDALSTGVTLALGSAPPLVRQTLQAESDLRSMLADPGASFSQMERVAVLAGMAPMGPGSRAVPSGRWSLHPDGYYVRYLPQGYSHTVTQIWVPPGSEGVGKQYDPATHIAVPGNTSRQRLIQSGRVYRN
jgi:hypothetical protein